MVGQDKPTAKTQCRARQPVGLLLAIFCLTLNASCARVQDIPHNNTLPQLSRAIRVPDWLTAAFASLKVSPDYKLPVNPVLWPYLPTHEPSNKYTIPTYHYQDCNDQRKQASATQFLSQIFSDLHSRFFVHCLYQGVSVDEVASLAKAGVLEGQYLDAFNNRMITPAMDICTSQFRKDMESLSGQGFIWAKFSLAMVAKQCGDIQLFKKLLFEAHGEGFLPAGKELTRWADQTALPVDRR
jgi:hypothetical protein